MKVAYAATVDEDQHPGAASERRVRLDPAQRSGQILAAATRRFRSEGYSAVSMEDVAADVGVARGLLHHYFGSKRDLFLAVVELEVRVPSSVPIVPEGASGDLDSVIAICVEWWLDLVEAAGGLWSGGADSSGFADSDVEAVLIQARDELVERMLNEVPFPPADRVLLRTALRCFGALARVATGEWIEQHVLTRAQVAELLRTSMLDLVQRSVPAMQAVAPPEGTPDQS